MILLGNHGVITIGQSVDAVRVAMSMTVKAAEIFVGAHALGGNVPMPHQEVDRIENRLDEEYRRRMLRILGQIPKFGIVLVLIVGPKLFIEPGTKAFFRLSSVSGPGL